VISLTAPTFGILSVEQDVLDNGAPKEKYDEVGEHSAVSGIETGSVCFTIDIGGNNTVQITPTYDKS
jgi:hypothetical protein